MKERVFYHGTLLENLDSINKNGLMPNTRVNKKNWKFSKPNSIYLTTELETAKMFACPELPDDYVILEIKESALGEAKLIPDEAYANYGGSWSFRVEGITITDFKVKEVI